jgi:phenylacetate-coenzyme A ligase PaaK-like adenylate-forming protein
MEHYQDELTDYREWRPVKLTPLEPWIAQKIGCPVDWLTRSDIEAYQLRRLQETLCLVRAKSPFYRRHLAGAPAELSSLEALAQFPFTTPEDVRRSGLQFLCVSQDDIQRVVTLDSSGTTGAPKRIYFTAEDQELTLDFFQIGMSTFTTAGDRVLILLPGERPGSVGDLLATALPRLGAMGIKHGPVRDAGLTLEIMVQEKVTGLVGLPAQALALARHRETSHKIPPVPLKNVLLTADHVPEAIKAVVERSWGCRVYNHYGMTEMGLGGGVECQARRGYHLREADLYLEIVDPDTGQPVPLGETGELVFTTLTRRGMPLIRYRTGDLSRFIPGDCPCGTILLTLERVRRRRDGNVSLGAGQSLTMAELDEVLFPIEGLLNFSAWLNRENDHRRLEIRARVVEGYQAAVITALRPALESIPAIGLAQRAGALYLTVAVPVETESPQNPSAKRMIRLTREGERLAS